MGEQKVAAQHRSDADLLLLGLPRVWGADGTEVVLERRDAAWLTILVLDGPQDRARIAELLWPDATDKQARNSLRQRLYRLRRSVGRDLVEGDGVLRLFPQVRTDIDLFAHRLAHDPGTAPGELLGGLDYADNEVLDNWVRQARERWRSKRLALVAEHASAREAQRELAAALPYAERLVREYPLLEHAHRRLMRLHYLRGDRAAALAAFHTCQARLREELGAAPNAETLQLAGLVQASGSLPPAGGAPRAVAMLRPPRLVGREAAWRALAGACATGAVALVEGEAGIGKSRLLGDFARLCSTACVAAQAPAPVHGARPGDARLPYAVLARVLRGEVERHGAPQADWVRSELARIVPELGPEAPGELRALRLEQAVLAACEQWHAPRAEPLFIDDLHFADEATLAMLPALASALCRGGVPCVLGVRSDELPAAVAAWLAAPQAERIVRVTLTSLDTGAVTCLLDSLDIDGMDTQAWAGPLARHTGGNPMFILQTLVSVLEADPRALQRPPGALPAPLQVGSVIEQRLARLSPAALKLVRLAAIAGQDFSVALACRVLRQDALDIADGWRELESAQVVRADAFAHDLVREATLRTVPAAIARVIHADVAHVLEDQGEPPARLAEHWWVAQHWQRAGPCFIAAAAAARQLSDRRLEAELLAQAVVCFEQVGDASSAFGARTAQFHSLRYVEGGQAPLEHAEALLRLAQTPLQRATALECVAMVHTDNQRDEAAFAAASAAGRIADDLGDAGRRMSAARLEARALSRLNRADEALHLLQRFQGPALAWEADLTGARVLSDLGATLILCDRPAHALPLLAPALERASRENDHGLVTELLNHRAWALCCDGQLLESTRTYEQACALRTSVGGDVYTTHDTALVRQYKELGRFDEALSLLKEMSVHHLRRTTAVAVVTECEAANLWLWLGQTARAVNALSPLQPDAAASMRAGHLLAQARIALRLGRPTAALLDEALRLVAHEGRAYYRLVLQGEQARSLPPDEAAAVATRALAESTELALNICTWPLTAIACDAQRRAGRVGEAVALAERLMSTFADRPPIILYPPEYGWFAAQAFLAAGDGAAADEALRRAVGWIREVALPKVPDEFRDGFLRRNPVNRAVLALARGREVGLPRTPD